MRHRSSLTAALLATALGAPLLNAVPAAAVDPEAPFGLAANAAVEAVAEPVAAQAEPPAPPRAAATEPFASVLDVDLHAVSDEVQVIGFHEAGKRQRAAAMAVREAVDANKDAVSGAVAKGTTMILPSRLRGTAPTSAVDIALPAGATVHSPVDGTVKQVADYRLYGQTEDQFVVVTPTGRPEVEVWMMHVDGVTVEAGDAVRASETPVAETARVLPFVSQVERYSGTMPHVHVHVRQS